jgi:hypothetical protein
MCPQKRGKINDLINEPKPLWNSMPLANDKSHNNLVTCYKTANETVLLELHNEGLKETGTRNDALVGLSRLYKNHFRMNKDECYSAMIEWMRKQDPKFYKTPLVECYQEIRKIAKYAYLNNYGLSGANYSVELTEKEIEVITTVELKSGKLLLFSILLFSKIHANEKGIFYMAFCEMMKLTGFSDKTCQTHLNELVKKGYIDPVSRGKPTKDGKRMETNLYKVLISPGKGVKKIKIDVASKDKRIIRSVYHKSLSVLDHKILENNLKETEYEIHERCLLHIKIIFLLSSRIEMNNYKSL